MTWSNTYTTTNTTTMTYPVYTNIWPVTVTSIAPPPPREPTPLEWLDREIDATCALARAA